LWGTFLTGLRNTGTLKSCTTVGMPPNPARSFSSLSSFGPGRSILKQGRNQRGTLLMTSELVQLTEAIHKEEDVIRKGGGKDAIGRQHAKGRLTARERIEKLADAGTAFFELGLWAARGMYKEWGGAPSAGVVTGIASVAGRRAMIIANDATVKAGAFFPMTCKKVLRAQRIATDNRLPLI
jgi:acetyl-CoA carboxylase carboxyltransferase component